MKEQLLVLVEWAKYIPAFCELPLDDQVREDTVCRPCGPRGGGVVLLLPTPLDMALDWFHLFHKRMVLMCAWSCLSHFTNVSSFNPSDNPREGKCYYDHHIGEETGDTERLNNLLKVTQLVSNTAGVRTSREASESRPIASAQLHLTALPGRMWVGSQGQGLSRGSEKDSLCDLGRITSSP